MGSLRILTCLIVLVVIILSKAYKRLVFCLVVYFTVVEIFQAVTHIIELTPIEHMNGTVVVKEGAESLCAFYGFLEQLALRMGNVATIWSCCTCCGSQTSRKGWQRGADPDKIKISTKRELVGLFFLFVFPLTFNWIPFIRNMYGISGLWCWIKESRDYCSDYVLGLTLIFSMYYAPLIIKSSLCSHLLVWWLSLSLHTY